MRVRRLLELASRQSIIEYSLRKHILKKRIQELEIRRIEQKWNIKQ